MMGCNRAMHVRAEDLLGQRVENRPLDVVQLIVQRGCVLEERLRVDKVLQALGASARGVGSGAQLLVEEVRTSDDAKPKTIQLDLHRTRQGGSKLGVIRKLDRHAFRTDPILGMSEATPKAKPRRLEFGTREGIQSRNSQIDVQCGPRLRPVDLQGDSANDRVRCAGVCKHFGKRNQGRAF